MSFQMPLPGGRGVTYIALRGRCASFDQTDLTGGLD
jgi:hypothetical protein